MPQPVLDISLQRESAEPIYRQLMRQIAALIAADNLPPGSRLPASRSLARELQISRISVVKAYAELRSAGQLSAHPGPRHLRRGG